ncbi:MAG: DinB family protein [Candidatus Thorarchaeota archaeon]
MSLLERLGEYLSWADTAIWEIVKDLSDEEFDRSFGEYGGSIRKRYTHLAEDAWEWYHDWIGKHPEQEPDFQNMTREQLFDSLSDYSHRFIEMIDHRTVEEIELKTAGKTTPLSFDEFLFHIVNHATYHRGQIAMGLRMLDKKVRMTDYIPFRKDTVE